VRPKILAEYSLLIGWAVISIIVVFILRQPNYTIAFFTFGAVISASLLIAWAAEASEFSISKGLALALVAIVQTIPEYFVEGTIAWKAGKDPLNCTVDCWVPNVIANFTGANRLLTGLGWPLIMFTVMIQKRRNGRTGPTSIALRKEQSVELVFMLGSSLYYIFVMIRGELSLLDSLILSVIFVGYMWLLFRLPSEKEGADEVLEGPPRALMEVKPVAVRLAAIIGLFVFAGLTFVFVTDSFVESIRTIAVSLLVPFLGSGAVFFSIQWIAPVLSEFPEKISAFNWARTIRLAPTALLNFMSSSVNELTALVALIPIVFVISAGSVTGTIPIGQHDVEIFLTMAQSLYACAALLDLEYNVSDATILFTLWVVSTAIVELRLVVGIIFLVLAAAEVIVQRKRIIAFSAFYDTIRDKIFRKSQASI
jgi:cation:H+ antiporter